MSDSNEHKLQPNSLHCFVCGMGNQDGLRLRFYETGPDEVSAEYTVPEKFEGYPGLVHGGIVTAMLDEVTVRAHIKGDPPRFMYTAKLEIKFRKNVPIGKPLRIVGHVEKSKSRLASSKGMIYGPDGDLLVEASALLVNLPQEQLEGVDLDALGWKIYEQDQPIMEMSEGS